MKEYMFSAILVLMGIMALTSCHETNKEEGDGLLTTELCIMSSQDLIDVCDIEVTYKGKGGVNMTDTITTTEWKKTIVNDSFPAKIGIISSRYLLKPGVKHDKENYCLESRYTVKTLEGDFETDFYVLRLKKVPGSKVDNIVEMLNYFGKDNVQHEADSTYIISSVVKAIKDTSNPDSVKFTFDYGSVPDKNLIEVPVAEPPAPLHDKDYVNSNDH